MAWKSYRPTPGKNTVRYRNTETGETRSRRQHEKSTLDPKKYNQYYRKGVITRKTEKFTKKSNTKHKVISVTRWEDLQNLLKGQKPPKGKDLTAFVRVIDHKTGQEKQTQSVHIGGDWRYLLTEYAVSLARKYFTPPNDDGGAEDMGEGDLSDDEKDGLVDQELQFDLVFVSSL